MKENYVSFETAKLLKEKGFDWEVRLVYHSYKQPFFHRTPKDFNGEEYSNLRYEWYSCPTLQTATMWLEEMHHILVIPDYIYECTDTSWRYKLYRLEQNGKPQRREIKGVSYDKDNNPTVHIVGYRDYDESYEDYATREEACEAAIKYCLENLI